MIKEVKSYRTGGSTVLLQHNGSSWHVVMWGVFRSESEGFINKRTNFGSNKYAAMEFYAERERELAVRDAMMALLGPPTHRR